MQILKLPYEVWKTVVQTNDMPVFRLGVDNISRIVWAGARSLSIEFVYHASFANDPDVADYNTTFGESEMVVASADDAMARIAGYAKGTLVNTLELRPNRYSDGVTLTFPGVGDDPESGRWKGSKFRLRKSTAGDESMTFGFNDWIQLSGGAIRFQNASFGDEISYTVKAPATATPPTQAGGNCVLAEVIPRSGLYTIVPVPPGDGTHQMSADALGAAVPVNAQGRDDISGKRVANGFWDWNWPDEGKGTVSPNSMQTGWFNLYTFPITLANFVPCNQLLGTGTVQMDVSALRPQYILPQWQHEVTLHNEDGGHDLQAVWMIQVARMKTT